MEELMIKFGTNSGDLKEIDLKDLFTVPPGSRKFDIKAMNKKRKK